MPPTYSIGETIRLRGWEYYRVRAFSNSFEWRRRGIVPVACMAVLWATVIAAAAERLDEPASDSVGIIDGEAISVTGPMSVEVLHGQAKTVLRAVPEVTRTSLPLRRTVFAWPWRTSTLIGPVTLMASPSMIPTESEAGSSRRSAAAAINVAQRTAMHAAGTMARHRHSNDLEQALTRDTPILGRRQSRLYHTSAPCA